MTLRVLDTVHLRSGDFPIPTVDQPSQELASRAGAHEVIATLRLLAENLVQEKSLLDKY